MRERAEDERARGEKERQEAAYLEAEQRGSGAAGDEEEQLAFLLVREALHHLPEGLDDRVGGRVAAWDQETDQESFTLDRRLRLWHREPVRGHRVGTQRGIL